MGCCVSRDENKSKHDPNFPCISKSPPRPEEETVKEVLSETPQPRPEPDTGPIKNVGPDPDPDLDPDPDPEEVRILKPTKPKPKPKTKPNTGISQKHLPINAVKSPGSGRVCTTPEPEPEEVSDVSEMCTSLSESISTTTIKEDEHGTHNDVSSEVVQRIHKPIPKGQNGNFTHRGCASPGRRRSDPSPTRPRNTGPGPGPGRVMDSDPGYGRVEGQRRSRSPVTRSNSNCRQSPSRRRAGLSPGRVRMDSGQKRENEVKKMEEVNNERRRGNENENENENESEWDGPNESLENPLVSLECFIFL